MSKISTITFDVFGTLLSYEPDTPWILRYVEEVQAVNEGKKPWRPLSEIFQEIGADWQAMQVRPGVLSAMGKLNLNGPLVALSNADWRLMQAISQHFGLKWDRIVATERAKAFKPNPRVYCMALRDIEFQFNDCYEAEEILHVAAHKFDLRGARAMGYKTAFVRWPGYAGAGGPGKPGEFDFEVESLEELADKLSA